MRDILIRPVADQPEWNHNITNTRDLLNLLPKYDMQTSTKAARGTKVPLVPVRDLANVRENDYTDGNWMPILLEELLLELMRETPDEHKHRWEQYLFSIAGITALNAMPRFSDPDELDDMIYKTAKGKPQGINVSLAGQVLYDVTREQTLIKTLGKGT